MKHTVSTAFGTTDTISGNRDALKTVFSLLEDKEKISLSLPLSHTNLVYETHMTWSISVKTTSNNLLVIIELPSAKPKSEWSVNIAFTPIVRACNIPS